METRRHIIIDTGFLVAILSRRDRYHKDALQCRSKVEKRPWISTWPVLTETSYLLSNHSRSSGELEVFSLVEKGALGLFDLRQDHVPRIKALMTRYRDLPMDLADASLVILAEELDNGDILSTDRRDFGAYRFKNHKPFRNLLLP